MSQLMNALTLRVFDSSQCTPFPSIDDGPEQPFGQDESPLFDAICNGTIELIEVSAGCV